MRLQKFLSQAEVCSRRKAEELIADGKVRVNGKVAELGQSVVAGEDVVKIGSKTIVLPERKPVVLMLNKPRGYVCANLEPDAGKTVFDLVPEEYASRKLFCVGRLDKDSEGLLLITNDGALANKIIHPSSGIVKRYEVTLNREFDPALTPRLLKGAKVKDENGEDEFLQFSNVIRFPDGKKLEVHLNQGRKREIRRLFEIFGFFVKTLRRFQIGGLVMRKMPVGDCRKLSKKEIGLIFSARGNASHHNARGKSATTMPAATPAGGRAKLRGEKAFEPSKTLRRENRKFEKLKEREAIIEEKIRVKRDIRRAAFAEKLAAEALAGIERRPQNPPRRDNSARGNAWAKEIRPHVKKARTRGYASRKGAAKAALSQGESRQRGKFQGKNFRKK